MAGAEERIVVNNKRAGPLLDKHRKCSVEVAFAAGVQDTKLLLPDCTSRRLHILHIGLSDRIGRIDEKSNHPEDDRYVLATPASSNLRANLRNENGQGGQS